MKSMYRRALISVVVLTVTLLVAPASFAQDVRGTATILRNANLRSGPGTHHTISGGASQGDQVEIIGCNATCDWYELASGEWIATFLVELVAPAPDDAVITVVTWNTELNDADIDIINQRIAEFEDVDLWGLTEVNRSTHQAVLTEAAAAGEAADFESILSQSGGGDRMVAMYDATRFELIDSWEVDLINTTGNARAALVLQLYDQGTGTEFLFLVNHLYRSRADERHRQAELLHEWAATQTLPVITGGDFNFDWNVNGSGHDEGYDRLTAGDRFVWIQPDPLVTTQCSGWPCTFNSVLDFVFVAGAARNWRAESEIVVAPNDFPDDHTTSDHRPVLARLWPNEQTARFAEPTVVATANPTALPTTNPTANRNANLRGGPGTNYAVAGSAQQGQALVFTGRNGAGDWYQLESGAWIAAFLVNGAPTDLKVVAAPVLPTPEPAAPTAIPVPAQPTPTPVPAQPVAPAGTANVVIQSVFYDGYVSRVESDEYAVIANTGTASTNIGGWRLNAGDDGQDFRFPNVELAPGQRVRVYTNEVHPETGGFSFRSGRAIWNNRGDCGYLYDAGGNIASTWCY